MVSFTQRFHCLVHADITLDRDIPGLGRLRVSICRIFPRAKQLTDNLESVDAVYGLEQLRRTSNERSTFIQYVLLSSSSTGSSPL